MRLTESIISAISSVLNNKMRTFLTMLGIIIGISSVIMINSVGNGVKAGLNKEFDKLGSNLMAVYLKSWESDVKPSDFLTMDDVELLRSNKNVAFVSPVCSSSATVELKNRTKMFCNITGTTADYRKQGKMELVKGRFITDGDNSSKTNCVVINEWLAKSIFGYTDVIGKSFMGDFNGINRELTIVGILKSEENDMVISAYGKGEIFMAYETVNDFYNNDYVDMVYVGAKDVSRIDETVKEVDRLLSISHGNENMYIVESYASQIGIINKVLTGFTLFIAFVAAISLLVGGIGVMNIMLVTVTERTREIGIRKSLGATDSNIRVQFLIEAVILSMLGGFIGVLLGYAEGIGAGVLISHFAEMNMSAKLSVPAVIGTVLITAAVGVIFGVYPAGKAAKMDPIEALRYE